MFSYRTDIAECIIRNELKDWFKKLINETFGPDVQIRYLSNTGHFNAFTYIEISGSENLIRQAVEFIISTSEILNYKMPWISENSYYVYGPSEKLVIKKLQSWRNRAPYFDYFFEKYNIIGITISMVTFPPHLDDTLKMELDKRFKLLADPTPLFIMYPKTTASLNPSSNHKPINILTVFHGEFLSYLSTEDILSLEIANKKQQEDSYHDKDLNNDIQKFLQKNFSLLNEVTDNIRVLNFRINEVLTYFIHKYHSRFVKCFIPNILTADEVQSLTRSYNIEFLYHNIIHIDFRPTNEAEKVDFCAIYHMDTSQSPFYNYDPKYATQNYSINFNADNSLDPIGCTSEFSMFVVKSQANCSPQKLNSILQYVTEHFSARQPNSILVLYEFDLNQVSRHIISSLVQMMRHGFLLFREMNLSSKTLIEILDQADHNRIEFRKCCITIENVEIFEKKSSKFCELVFCDMVIDVNLFYILKNVVRLFIKNCRILSTSSDIPINMNISNARSISFIHTTFDISTLLRLLNCVQFVREITFADCNLTSCDLLDSRYFTFQNSIRFINMIFEIQNLFQIFEYCEMQNEFCFQSCHFRCVNNSNYKSSRKPVKIEFHKTSFDLPVLLKILETLHDKSAVWIAQSRISVKVDTSHKFTPHIKLKRIIFTECRIEMQTLCRILRQMCEHTDVHMVRCDLSPPIVINSCTTVNISKIVFFDMRFNPQEFFTILGLFKENSKIQFKKCEITTGSVDFSKIRLPNRIVIYFLAMSIESQIVRPLLQTDSEILFDDCGLNFITEIYPNISIEAQILFRNITFELSEILKYLANFTPKSKIRFICCDFTTTKSFIPTIEIEANAIMFENMSFDLEILLKFMERIAEQTILIINRCNIQLTKVFSIRPIKLINICFENMNLEIETILRILKNFSNYPQIHITSCQMLCSNPNELSNLNHRSSLIVFHNMKMDIQIFQIFLQKCTNGTIICLEGCKIRPHDNILSIVSVDIDRLVFVNINYSSDLLQILQYVNGQFIVEFHGDLSNEAIIEICTKTPVHGKRLWLATQICPKSFYFELFADYFQQKVLNFEINKEAKYDLPTFLIPHIISVSGVSEHYWSEFVIKIIPVNDTSMKLEFLRNGKPVDLFYELNDLPDDSDVCVETIYN